MSSAIAVAKPKHEGSAAPVQRKVECETRADSEPQEVGTPRWLQSQQAPGSLPEGAVATARAGAAPAAAAASDGAGPAAGDVGNEALQRSLRGGGVRGKLEVSGVDDPEEHEADRLAASVLADSDKAPCPSYGSSAQVRRKSDGALGGNTHIDGFGHGTGRPLDRATRAFFEPRFGADLGAVRVHDDPSTRTLAASIGARAFTIGADIGFADGEFDPNTGEGRFLLAHELAHVSCGHDGVRRDIQDDFEGRPTVPAATTATRPPGTIRYQLPTGEQVYAPYGIYRPGQIPTWLHMLTMESSQALVLRYPGQSMVDIFQQISAGTLIVPNPTQITIGDMVRYAEQQGPEFNLRILIAVVDGGYRFLGYDTSSAAGGQVYSGFIESNRAPGVGRTGGVGQALFADRVTRALAGGASEMLLEVYTSEGTVKFHAEIWRIAGISGAPAEGDHYQLDTRQMVRVALVWSEALTPAERQELVRFAVMQGSPSPAAVQSALSRAAPRGGASATSSAGTPGPTLAPSGEMMEMMRRFMNELRSSIRQPAEVESLRKLQEAETQERVLRDHAGFALAEGRLYRLEAVGQAMRISEVRPEPIIEPLAEPLGPVVEPTEAGIPRRILNLDPTRALRIGETVIPPSESSPAELKEGEFMVVGYERALEAVDPVTRRPLLGVYEGGRWYMIVGENMRGLDFDPVTGMRIVELATEGGGKVRAVELATDLPSQTALQRAPVSTTAVGVASVIMLANDILKWVGASLQVQRAIIERGKSEIDLWSRLGAAPVAGIWDAKNMQPAAHGTDPDTSWTGIEWYFPYVADINADLLRAELPRRVHSYAELAVLLASMGQLHAFEEDTAGRMTAVVNRPQGATQRRYDITEAIRTVEALTLASAEAAMRERLALRPATERQGRILRLRQGATLLRSKGEGWFNKQPLIGAGDRLGPDAWVREIRRSDSKLFVEPVNADAHQAVALSAYVINDDLEDVWRECKDGGREVHPAELPKFGDGPLMGFQAGPETTGDQRFGWTRYQKKPDNPAWTVAFGELRAFWVSEDDATVVTDDEVEAYLRK